MELKKVGILSLAKIAGLFGVIYGLISGILFSIIYSQTSKFPELGAQLTAINQLGYSSLIILPILNGLIYFVVAALIAIIYNLLAKKIGGIQLVLEDKKPKKK